MVMVGEYRIEIDGDAMGELQVWLFTVAFF